MLEIPRITPVRVKTEPIAETLLNPGRHGHYFPDGVGPRVIYLDRRYPFPDQTSDDIDTERARQMKVWEQVMSSKGGVMFLEKAVEDDSGLDKVDAIRGRVAESLGHRNTAEFYERVFSELFAETLEIVAISTGITHFTRETYHDIGYVRK